MEILTLSLLLSVTNTPPVGAALPNVIGNAIASPSGTFTLAGRPIMLGAMVFVNKKVAGEPAPDADAVTT